MLSFIVEAPHLRHVNRCSFFRSQEYHSVFYLFFQRDTVTFQSCNEQGQFCIRKTITVSIKGKRKADDKRGILIDLAGNEMHVLDYVLGQ